MSTLTRWAAALTVVVAGLASPGQPSASAVVSPVLAPAAAPAASAAPAPRRSAARKTELALRVRSISAGGEHTCSVNTDQTLWCWGRNTYGQLGIKRSGPYAVAPEQVGTRSDWRQVSAGGSSTCGVRGNGTLWCWGVNHRGQLGNGTTKVSDRPVQVGKKTTWATVSVGYTHACAIRTSGSLWCWGDNSAGQLGTGKATGSGKPTRVSGTQWKKVVVGGWHTCGLTTEKTLWCWGRNVFGQLGTGSYQPTKVPTQVGAGKWRSVALSWTHTCGVTTAGQARCWGRNLEGQLGDGTTTVSPVPRIVAGQPKASAVAVNEGTSCLLSSSKQVWCWGSNSYGAFGQGSLDDTSKARRTRRLGALKGISGGWLHACAIGADSKPTCWGSNERGQLGVVPPDLAPPPAGRTSTPRTSSSQQRKDGPLTFGIASMNALGMGHSRPYADADHFAPARIRAEWTFDAVDLLGASVVGLQEPSAEQLAAIVAAGDGAWEVYPTPDEGDRRVESPLAWRTDQWEAVEKTTIRTQFINRSLARPVVKLRHRATGKEIWVVNVHNAPWEYQAKRDAAVKVELAKIQELEATGLPVFFVGDMNEKRTIVCKVLDQTGLVSPGGGRIDATGACVTPKVMRVDWIFGPATATYSGFTHSRHPLVSVVTDHWVPVVRATIP